MVTTSTGWPSAFDARDSYGTGTIVMNQGNCGSCWAFSAATSFAGRLMITGQTSSELELSPQVLVTCDTDDTGCNGGLLSNAWTFLTNTGTTTWECVPYLSYNCTEGHDSNNDGCTTCTFDGTCTDGSSWPATYKARGQRSMLNDAEIISELWVNGPVQTAYNFYQNFWSWDWEKNPVYDTTDNSPVVGGHAVTIIGWGTLDGTDYWCANHDP